MIRTISPVSFLAITLIACDVPKVDLPSSVVTPTLTIGDGGVLPWVPGGKFRADVYLPQPQDDGGTICGAASAQFDISPPTLATGAVTSSKVALVQDGMCGPYRGVTELAFPEGGRFQVQLRVLGSQVVQEAVMDKPDLAITRNGLPSRVGDHIRVPVCVATTVSRGNMTVNTDDGTIGGQSSVNMPLRGDTPCASPALLESPARTYAAFDVLTTAESISLNAKVDQGPSKTATIPSVESLAGLMLELRVSPNHLPDAGASLLEVTVGAKLDGGIASGIPVRLETLPDLKTLPSGTAVTGADGGATFLVAVPKELTVLRVDAVSGAVRVGETITQ